jgi:hypothetical protein
MPKFNADEQTQLAESIELVIGGKTYTVKKLSMSLLEEIEEIGKKPSTRAVVQQFCVLTGSEPEDFTEVDIRKLSAALDFITKAVKDGIASKNV